MNDPAEMHTPGDEALEAARSAKLRYVSDAIPGMRRRRAGGGFAHTATAKSSRAKSDRAGELRVEEKWVLSLLSLLRKRLDSAKTGRASVQS